MRRIGPHGHGTASSPPRRWRKAGAALVIGTALAAVGAAEIAAKPDDPDELARTLIAQKVKSGDRVVRASARADVALTAPQMVALTDQYETFIRKSIDDGEVARMSAYRSKDIIRMTCVDDKLLQMKNIFALVEPRFITIHVIKRDEQRLRSQYLMLQQSWERIRTLVAELEACLGDSLDTIAAERLRQDLPKDSLTDQTRPLPPGNEVERPPEASPYQ